MISDKKTFVLYLLPKRPDFAQTMNEEEIAVMKEHIVYWKELMNQGSVIAFGPVMDPREIYGLGIILANDEQEVAEIIANDPAGRINNYEYFPMRAVLPAR